MDVERLSQLGNLLDTRQRKKKREKIKTEKSFAANFSQYVDPSIQENSEVLGSLVHNFPPLDGTETLESLLDELHTNGDALKRDAVLGPLKEYKNSVRHFLRYILEHSIEVEETMGVRNPKSMQQKKYTVIRIVDEKLENLATSVLKNQSEQWDILHRIDEINGLLVDLVS